MNTSYMIFPAVLNRKSLSGVLNKRIVTPDDIIQAVITTTGVDRDKLTGKGRQRKSADARKIAAFLFVKLNRVQTLQTYGNHLGCGHDLIIYYVKTAKALIETSKDFAEIVEECESKLK